MTEDDNRRTTLLQMHQFYTQEARHQRQMMWDTVKWFTPILLAIIAVWIKVYVDNFESCQNWNIGIILSALSVVGLILSIICMFLLKSFYKSNLQYITMFAKVEEELNFEPRRNEEIEFFKGDKYITYEEIRQKRMGEKFNKSDYLYTTSKEFVERGNKRKIDIKMISVFIIFTVVFALSFILLMIQMIL